MITLVLKIGVTLVIIQYVAGVCNVCNKNGASCINKKEFYLCEAGQANSSKKYSCLGDKICTKLTQICAEKTADAIVPACGETTNCGKCEGAESDGVYTCTSRTTYTICFDGALSDIRGTCPENQMCDISLGKRGQMPCVPNCKESQIEFCDLYDAIDVITTPSPDTTDVTESAATTGTALPDATTTELTTEALTTEATELPTTTTETNEVPITTTEISSSTTPTENPTTEQENTTTEITTTTTIFSPTPTTTIATEAINTTMTLPTTTENPAEIFCLQQTAGGRYPYPNDTTCKKYVYCFKKGGVMESTTLECKGYFNQSTTLCEVDKPQGCI